LPEAAKHLSGVCGEDVTVAEILRLALDGHLKLSVNFVNYTKARCGNVVGIEEVKWSEYPKEWNVKFPNLPDEAKETPVRYMVSLNIDDVRFLNLDDEVITIKDVWDLPMIGCEQLDIEHEYQTLTNGTEVTLQSLCGAFVESSGGVMCQLQESYNNDDPIIEEVFNDIKECVEKKIAKNDIGDLSPEHARNAIEEFQRKSVENRRLLPKSHNYYPAGGLPQDSVLVVRTDALRDFEKLLSDNEKDKNAATKPHGNTELNAQKREQILGAALSVVTQWADQCQNSSGKFEATKIAKLIDEKSPLFWSATGEPPLSLEKMEREISKWINKIGK
jgi:hypothetical protein